MQIQLMLTLSSTLGVVTISIIMFKIEATQYLQGHKDLLAQGMFKNTRYKLIKVFSLSAKLIETKGQSFLKPSKLCEQQMLVKFTVK